MNDGKNNNSRIPLESIEMNMNTVGEVIKRKYVLRDKDG